MPETSPTGRRREPKPAQRTEQRPTRSLPHHAGGEEAAVDAEDLAGDVARALVVEEEGDDGRDFLGPGITAERHPALEGAAVFGRMEGAHHRGVDGPRRNG